MKFLSCVLTVALLTAGSSDAFAPKLTSLRPSFVASSSALSMGLDPVTTLRTDWVSAALCTNQTPRSADICLQLGTDDGRAVTFIPKTIRELITSSAEKDGKLTLSARRQLKQQAENRQAGTKVSYMDQRADDLKEVEDETVDVVISLQAAQRMKDNGLDWKKSIREAARVLKPGGRFLFCEQTEIDGESYVGYAQALVSLTGEIPENEEERLPIFEEGDADKVPMCPIPHVAGVAIKSESAGMSAAERARREAEKENERLADLSITAYERGIKKRRRKKKNAAEEEKASTSK